MITFRVEALSHTKCSLLLDRVSLRVTVEISSKLHLTRWAIAEYGT